MPRHDAADREQFHKALPRPTPGTCEQLNWFHPHTHSRSPDLIERVVRQPCSGVRKSSVLPAKNDSEVGGKVLLGAVDVSDVRNPDSNGDLSLPRTGRWPINQGTRFRATRDLA